MCFQSRWISLFIAIAFLCAIIVTGDAAKIPPAAKSSAHELSLQADSAKSNGPKSCVNKSLEERAKDCDVIFTGTIKHLYLTDSKNNVVGSPPNLHEDFADLLQAFFGIFENGDESSKVTRRSSWQQVQAILHGGHLKAEVEIKRVIKGADFIKDLPELVHSAASAASGRGGARSTPPPLYGLDTFYHRMALVEGLENPALCNGRSGINDTRIFLVNKVGNEVLKLNSSMVRMTLKNIDTTDEIAKKFPSHKEPDITGRPSGNPCDRLICPFGAQCVPQEDNKVASCSCPYSCAAYSEPGDDPTTAKSQVCGSDDLTYPTLCDLRKAACKLKKPIQVKNQGKCSTVDSALSCTRGGQATCRFGAECDDTTGECVCRVQCSSLEDRSEPVCATDGSTYSSMCELRKQSCLQQRNINRAPCEDSSGASGEPDGCESLQCYFGGRCVMVDGEESCVCDIKCQERGPQVCGSNGKRYNNECEMKNEACHQQRAITKDLNSRCEDDEDYADEEQLYPSSICHGQAPLANPTTGRPYDCGPGREACPSNISYCQSLGGVSRCCAHAQVKNGCQSTSFGCCSDGKTAALGPKYAGCPEVCNCNALGSLTLTCDPVTSRCVCRPGVGGKKCNRCQPNFWGMHKISDGNDGCIPCGCHIYGSKREDCEQMSGKCLCLNDVTGQKCDVCVDGRPITGPEACGSAPPKIRPKVRRHRKRTVAMAT